MRLNTMPKDKDQDTSEVNKEEETSEVDQSESKQSEEATEKESLDVGKIGQLVQGLQKGYTLTRQEISEMKSNLQQIVDVVNKQQKTAEGDEEYLTVGKLKEILNQQSQEQEQRKTQADQYIEDTLATLKAEGKIASEEEADELLSFALEIKEPNLVRASGILEKVKNAKAEAKKEIAKTKTKQEEGSKVGTSSKTSEGESRGVNYDEVIKGGWF